MKPDLRVRIGSLELRNPILVASGIIGYGQDYDRLVDLSAIGGIVTKTVTRRQRVGNPPPRVVEVASGMLNSIGIENPGLEGFLEMPLAVGIVGGPIALHPKVRRALALVGAATSRELAAYMAAAGLAQNLAALRALGSVGIQRGHMALHARAVAASAGARGPQVEQIAQMLIDARDVKLSKARELLAELAKPSLRDVEDR